MFKWWRILANMAIPAVRGAGEAKKAEDANTTGKDDIIGICLVFCSELLDALVNGKPIPPVPEAIAAARGKVVA